MLTARDGEGGAGSDPLAGVDERVLSGVAGRRWARRPGRRRSPGRRLFGRLRAAAGGDAPGDPVPVPSDRVLYRIAAELDRGGHVFGAATTRRTTANRPDRPFTAGVEMRPGQQVHIDTNTVDIMCRYADGVTRRAELTIAVDVATRSIGAGVVAPSTKAVDAVAVLARMVVPDPLRPGWPESLLFAHSSLPFERLLSIDARFEQAAARPVILPDTIVCDRGSVYMAEDVPAGLPRPGHLGAAGPPLHADRQGHRGTHFRFHQHPVLPARGTGMSAAAWRCGEGPGRRGGLHRRPVAGPVRRMGRRGLAEPAA